MQKYDELKFKGICSHGDYNKVIEYLESVDDADEMLKKCRDIFEGGAYVLETQDERIAEFLRCYEDFLKWALTNETTTKECKKQFVKRFRKFFPLSFTFMQMYLRVGRFFKKKGYHVQFGITLPYPALYLWGKQTTETRKVELPEGSVEIEVCEMDEMIASCWMTYLSLGIGGTGGWVTKKGCTYFKHKYDTASDEFNISLLKHEGQHFFDKKSYPKMKSADLEYRAKLVELIYYKDLKRLFTFLEDVSEDAGRENPHKYAATKIVRALSERIFGKELETCRDLWTDEGEKVPAAALELLKEHSEKLKGRNGKSHII